jgi:hypothetical protein
VLTELARVRLHGFSERELAAAVSLEMADVESLYVERDQIYAQARRPAGLCPDVQTPH